MAHLLIQKYMNNSLILNIQIADTYLFYLHAINFLTSLKNTRFFISSDKEFHICCRKTLGNCPNAFPSGLSNLKHFVWFDETKHKTYY